MHFGRQQTAHLREIWSRSRAYRLLLIAVVGFVALRFLLQGVLLAGALFPADEGEAFIPADLQIYLDAARHFQQRETLYLQGSLERLEEHYPYAPAFALAFTPFLLLPPGVVAIIHTALHVLAYGLLYLWWGRIFHRLQLRQANEMLAWTLPVWLLFAAFWGDLVYLNIYIIVALLGTLLIEAVLEENLGLAVLWLSIILQIKPHWAFAAAIPLLLGRWRFFARLLGWAAVAYLGVVGVVVLVAGPDYGLHQYGEYFRFLARLSADFPWRGPEQGFLGYNHSIKQVVVFIGGVSPLTLNLATAIKVLLLAPLGLVTARYLLSPINRSGRELPQTGLDLAFALYMGVFIWLDMVWELSLGIAVFTYLLATSEQRNTKILVSAAFLPYALVDLWQTVSFVMFGPDVVVPGPYLLTDPSIYIPLILIVILTFYAVLLRRLWAALPALQTAPAEAPWPGDRAGAT